MGPYAKGPGPSTALAVLLAIAVPCVAIVPSSAASTRGHGFTLTTAAAARKSAQRDSTAGTRNSAARTALRRGYLVPDQAAYERQKRRLTRRAVARQALVAPAAGPLVPSIVPGKSWRGINGPRSAPPDETSAVGTSRYIELVNSRYAIYGKTGNVPLKTGSLRSLSGMPGLLFDVQVMWDPTTSRFYYAMDDVISRRDNRVAFGFSKGASPTSAADWCKYSVGFGSEFPDFPKLGDSRYFEIIGTNLYKATGNYGGSHLLAISKPHAGSKCPKAKSFDRGGKLLSKTAFTPVPANEIDTDPTGWAVAVAGSLPANKLRLFKVTRKPNGTPKIQGTGTPANVPEYGIPPNAPEKGSTNKIDTGDARNTQAVAGVDPGHGGKLAIWTQHAVKGGAGAEDRWYEIDPASHSILQQGRVTSPSLFEFNGAISPNRQVNGGTKTGGDTMVMNFDTSSKTTFPSIEMVSQVGAGLQSAPVAVLDGTKPLGGFDCNTNHFCRWGDYAAATPDPSTANRIWQVSQYAVGPAALSQKATSRTWNFVAQP